MAILASLKRAFGLTSATEEDFDGEFESSLSDNMQVIPGVPVLQPATDSQSVAHTELPLSNGGDMPVEVADAVIDIVDEALPPFVRDCIDRDAQRRKLLAVMGPAMHSYVARIAADTRSAAMNSTAGDRDKLQQEVDALRQEREKLDAKREEQSSQLLAEQRQRRALTERVRALEAKETTYEAEKEQYELEIKSLMNKLRLAETAGDVVVPGGDDASMVVTESDSRQDLTEAHEKEVAQLNDQIATLTARLAELEPMANDLQAERIHVAEYKAQLDAELLKQRQLRAQVTEMEQKLTAADRTAEIESLNKRIASLQAKLDDTTEVDGLNATIAAKDEEIVDLQNRLAEATAPAKLEELLAERQRMLNPEGEADAADVKTKRRRGRPRKTEPHQPAAADDPTLQLADQVDWLIPGDEPAAVVQHVADPEFGYRPPKPTYTNEAQLTLF